MFERYMLLADIKTQFKLTIYKADIKTNIYYIFGFVILFGVTIPLSSKFSTSSWPILIAFLFLFLLFNFLTYRLTEIYLDKSSGNLALKYKNFIGVKRTAKYSLKQIEYTYKIQAVSFRSGIKSVCSLYSSDKKVIQIIPDDDDWSDDEINRFMRGLLTQG